MPNAGGEPPPEAGARYERTPEAVGSTALFGAGVIRALVLSQGGVRWIPHCCNAYQSF